MELSLFLCQTPFSLPLLCDVHHHRDGAATRGPTAANAKPSPVRGMVLKTPARWIAQALGTFSDQSLDVALPAVAVIGDIAQKIEIGAARLKRTIVVACVGIRSRSRRTGAPELLDRFAGAEVSLRGSWRCGTPA